MQWKPITETLRQAQRPSESSNPRLKWEYQCVYCTDWFPKKHVEVDHLVEVGSLTCFEDLPKFAENLFCEVDNLVVACHKCHDIKTHKR
jgi:5-methylcytosine-specific restriction endonuclease McrA